MNVSRVKSILATAGLAALGAVAIATFINTKTVVKAQAPNPVGAWFGIARPCPTDPTTDSPDHAAFCQTICGTCPGIPGALPPEVPMMPTLLGDGTVVADDAGEIGRYHTTAHGKWQTNTDSSVLQLAGKQRFEATFFWLQSFAPTSDPGSLGDVIGKLGGTCCFGGGARPRFVTFFDPTDPDRMQGFIQPYLFPFVDPKTGLVLVNPPTNAYNGNHIPLSSVDPLVTLPPCTPANGCLGTYHFVIRRIKPQ
jgi:hypothetical protein